jgi:regulator of protease activity HflC (stomatin/prohibitin superfamily)
LWTGFREVKVERVDAHCVRFEHTDLSAVLVADRDGQLLERLIVPQGQVCLVYREGVLAKTLGPGEYAFWKGVASLKLYTIDQHEAVLDVAGQEIMTRDKVSLRMNALVTFRVSDATVAVSTSEDHRQAL